MEGLTLKIIVIGLTLLLAGCIAAFMFLVVKAGKKNKHQKTIFGIMEKHAQSQNRLISLLRDRKSAGEFDKGY
jgi:hypothetical protein